MERGDRLKNFLDAEARLKSWPARDSLRQVALEQLAERFEVGESYTEKEVNEMLNRLHCFNDPALLRRELYQRRLLDRTLDGSSYWRPAPAPAAKI